MENEAFRRALVSWRIDRPPERDREDNPRPNQQAPARTPESGALFQTVSRSDDNRRSTRDPAQGADTACHPDDPREGRDAGGIAWRSRADTGVNSTNEWPRPQ